jgi:hypothetical protein
MNAEIAAVSLLDSIECPRVGWRAGRLLGGRANRDDQCGATAGGRCPSLRGRQQNRNAPGCRAVPRDRSYASTRLSPGSDHHSRKGSSVSARRPGRAQKIAYDETRSTPQNPDIDARIGWLLAKCRLHDVDEAWQDGPHFAQALADAGLPGQSQPAEPLRVGRDPNLLR